MRDIVIAKKNGLLHSEDGSRYRIVAGKTLAHADHEAVLAYPDNFMPVEVELACEESDPGHMEDDIAVELGELRDEAEGWKAAAEAHSEALEAIVQGLKDRHIVPKSTDSPGWLADLVLNAIDSLSAALDKPAAPSRRKPIPAPKPDVADG